MIHQPEKTPAHQWRKVGWNGVCLEVPASWDIGEIGQRYLLLETVNGPQLEINWGPVKGKFSPRRQLKRLVASQSRHLRKDLREMSLPAQWTLMLGRYKSIGFHWRSGTTGGRGAVLYCPVCRQATLLQFHQAPYNRPIPYASRLLASFTDHAEQSKTDWSVFDIHAKIPTVYQLKAFRFDVGRYEIVLSDRATSLTLHRWGPADTLLGEGGLAEFGRKYLGYFSSRSMMLKTLSSRSVEGEDNSRTGLLHRLQKHIRRQPLYSVARLWNEEEKNRILGVRLEGRKPIDPLVFHSICANYGTI